MARYVSVVFATTETAAVSGCARFVGLGGADAAAWGADTQRLFAGQVTESNMIARQNIFATREIKQIHIGSVCIGFPHTAHDGLQRGVVTAIDKSKPQRYLLTLPDGHARWSLRSEIELVMPPTDRKEKALKEQDIAQFYNRCTTARPPVKKGDAIDVVFTMSTGRSKTVRSTVLRIDGKLCTVLVGKVSSSPLLSTPGDMRLPISNGGRCVLVCVGGGGGGGRESHASNLYCLFGIYAQETHGIMIDAPCLQPISGAKSAHKAKRASAGAGAGAGASAVPQAPKSSQKARGQGESAAAAASPPPPAPQPVQRKGPVVKQPEVGSVHGNVDEDSFVESCMQLWKSTEGLCWNINVRHVHHRLFPSRPSSSTPSTDFSLSPPLSPLAPRHISQKGCRPPAKLNIPFPFALPSTLTGGAGRSSLSHTGFHGWLEPWSRRCCAEQLKFSRVSACCTLYRKRHCRCQYCLLPSPCSYLCCYRRLLGCPWARHGRRSCPARGVGGVSRHPHLSWSSRTTAKPSCNRCTHLTLGGLSPRGPRVRPLASFHVVPPSIGFVLSFLSSAAARPGRRPTLQTRRCHGAARPLTNGGAQVPRRLGCLVRSER